MYKKGKIYLKISSNSSTDTFNRIKDTLKKYSGDTPVYLYLEKEKKTVVADRTLWIDIGEQNVIIELKKLLGEESVKIS